MNHKRNRPKNRRGGCLLCKFWKVNGFATERKDGERFSDHRRRYFAGKAIQNLGKSSVVRDLPSAICHLP